MKDSNYLVIQGWMINQLKLGGNELLVYAIIYGFSQDGESVFSGGCGYLAESIGVTKQAVFSILKKLVEKKLIIRTEKEINGVLLVDYKAAIDKYYTLTPSKETLPPPVKKLDGGGSKETLPHNINNKDNIKDNIEREIEREPSPASPTKSAFTPPTYKEMIDYAHLMDDTAGVGGFRCTREMADEFWAYYTANGWVNSNQFRTPILDWKAKFRQWVVREKKNNKDEYIEAPIITNQ